MGGDPVLNIGEALIEILADAGDFAKDASKQLSGPLKTVGKTTADAFSATFQIGMAAAAGLATAAITKTISGGLKRLEGIDTAERSEERRVGKEWRAQGAAADERRTAESK